MKKNLQKNHGRLQLVMAGVLLVIVSIVAVNLKNIVNQKPADKQSAGEETTEIHNGRSIIIDPGHGGDDPGKVGVGGELEKDINLNIALKLKELLEKEGYEVVLTREMDKHLSGSEKIRKVADLNRRCEIINNTYRKNPDAVMISIHQNSFTNKSVHGAQCFYYTKSEKSKCLAEMIQQKANQKVNTHKEKRIKSNDNYYMLINSKCPGVIIECGFLSNPEEAARLETEEYQYELANMIKDGINNFHRKDKKGM